jgi:hypothetical protein
MSVKDDDADGIHYIVVRDTVDGGQSTQWHFWTLSEKIGTPADAVDRAKFLIDAPGAKIRQLVDRLDRISQEAIGNGSHGRWPVLW